jgi:hypothetical protein
MSSLTPSPMVSDVIPGVPVIPPIDYSDRDYQSILNDLVKLIPTYLPEWTDRSPGDFGIVLLELFSYTADILNYYIDRVGGEAFLATAQQRQSILNIAQLLDYTPHNAVSAITQLQFTISSPSDPVRIDKGTQVQTASNGTQAITFETTQDMIIWGDGYSTKLSVTSNGAAFQRFLLGGPYDGNHETVTVGGTAWSRATGNTLTGQVGTAHVYIVTGGTQDPVSGLLIDGVVQFGDNTTGAIPSVNNTIVIIYQPAANNVYAGLVNAEHGTTINGEAIGYSNGLPNQSYTLFRTPVVDGSILLQVDEGFGPQTWTYYQRLVDAFSTDMAYTINTDANGIVTIIFGDGVTGQVPYSGANITATYRVGGGVVGNVGPSTLTQLASPANVLSVTNPNAASGGADAETTDHIRIHAPLSITAINRAVTLDDYAALVLNIPTIAKASSFATYYNAVDLYVHPTGDFYSDVGVLSQRVTALATTITNTALTGYMDDKKMATVSIQVMPPKYNRSGTQQTGYVPVDVTATVQVLDQYHQSVVQSAVQANIANLMLFSVVDFGYTVTLSSVYHAAQNTPGVDWVNVTLLCRDEQVPSNPVPANVVCAAYEIPQANVITVNAQGGLLF